MANATLSKTEREKLLATLRTRFEKNMNRHQGLQWADVEATLTANPQALRSLYRMESTGGEPDVIGLKQETGRYVFCDCSPESPKGRCGVCYDREGEQKRIKEGLKPAGNVLDMAAAMGIEPLTEAQYRELQKLGGFDTKTQSWLKTPAAIAKLGGALYAERRFDTVFVSHNTPPCFYRGRGFRGVLKV
jgi:hypothetical protein